jgi:hypothetical protein
LRQRPEIPDASLDGLLEKNLVKVVMKPRNPTGPHPNERILRPTDIPDPKIRTP